MEITRRRPPHRESAPKVLPAEQPESGPGSSPRRNGTRMTGSTTDRAGALEHRGRTVASVQPERCGTKLDAAPAGIEEATRGLRSRPAENVSDLEEQEARNAVVVIR